MITKSPSRPPQRKTRLSGWGRYPAHLCDVRFPREPDEFDRLMCEPHLVRGLGRSYGDASLPARGHAALQTLWMDKLLALEREKPMLEAEAGVSIKALLDDMVPKGLFLPVVPGTAHVTLGGAVASNIHGKNHHRNGSIENALMELDLATPAGKLRISRATHPSLFNATVGGYGLTGGIRRIKLGLLPIPSAYLKVRHLAAKDLDCLFRLFDREDPAAIFSVAWLDALAPGRALGRGILMVADWALPRELPLRLARHPHRVAPLRERTVPSLAAGRALHPLVGRVFNLGYWHRASLRGSASIQDYRAFFFPLDRLLEWNRLYGPEGLLQYQMALPDPDAEQGIAESLGLLRRRRLPVYLAVLKRCAEDTVALPFAKRGYTLALDLPNSERVRKGLEDLDEIVTRRGGRVYLTKDARLSPQAFRNMYPEAAAWMAEVRRWNPARLAASALSERLRLWEL